MRYLAYGSNTWPTRFRAYIDGAGADSPFGPHGGSTDRSPTRVLGTRWIVGRLMFGGSSRRWGGGVAFALPGEPGPGIFVVEYEITRAQLTDLAMQENGNDAQTRVDWHELARSGDTVVSQGLYGRLTMVGPRPAALLTAPDAPKPAAPTPAYLQTVRRGLRHWLGASRADAYLAESLEAAAQATRG